MLKKRILASSLASVMALSSVSVVAFADETATTDIKTEVVSKAMLKEYVKSFEDFVDEKLDDYGEIQSEWFNNALNAAQAAVDSRFSTDEEITAAYQMLKAVNNKLTMYTQAELAELVADCKADYDTENKYNKNFGDEIWYNDDDQYDDFEDAYEHAEDYLDSEDSADLNDAYLGLELAHSALSMKESVTKSQFRKAYDEYAQIAGQFSNYEDWMRGTATVDAETTDFADSRGNKIALSGAKFITFGEIKNIVYGTSANVLSTANSDGRKRLNPPFEGTQWITWDAFNYDAATATNVNEFVEYTYKYFLDNADSNVTTDPSIVKAYKAAVDAVKVFKGWEAKVTKGSSARVMRDLLKDNRDNFIKDGFADDFVASMDATVATFYDIFDYDYTSGTLKVKEGKEAAAGAIIVNKNTGTFAYNDEYEYEETAANVIDTDDVDDVMTLKDLNKKDPKAGDNLMRYVPMTYQMVKAGAVANAAISDADATTIKTNAQAVLDAIAADISAHETTINSAVANTTTKTALDGACTALDGYIDAIHAAMGTLGLAAAEPYATLYAAIPAAAPSATGDPKVEADDITAAKAYLNKVKAAANAAKKVAQKAYDKAKDAVGQTVDTTYNLATWYTNLADAMDIYDDCLANEDYDKEDKDFKGAVSGINATQSVGKTDTKDAYSLLINYATFALDNLYPAASSYKSLDDITKICEKAAELIEKTGDASFDPLKGENSQLAEARQAAIEWVAIAKKKSDYKPGDKLSTVKNDGLTDKTSTDVYNSVNNIYKNLNLDFAEWPYSYGEIAETIAEVAEGIDTGIYGASAASIKTAAEDIAFTLATHSSVSPEENVVFDDDSNFLASNRLRAKGKGVTAAEKAFTKKYEALLAAVEEATKEPETPEVVKGDLTGDGVATPEDAVMIVKAFVGEITLTDAQKAAADFNGDGVVNADDALAVVKAYVGL